MVLPTMGLLAAITAKHEFAHVAAGAFLGVHARWRFGHRLFFPAVETDLSDLWMVERRKRYVAYGAGVFSDVLTASLALMGLWAHAHGWITLTAGVRGANSGSARAALALTAVLLVVGIGAERRRTAARYRLICPAGLLLLLAVSAPAVVADARPGPVDRCEAALEAGRSSAVVADPRE